MHELLMKVINKKKITEQDIVAELLNLCERIHASCNDDCPVYEKNDHHISGIDRCHCYKSGERMLQFLKEHNKG